MSELRKRFIETLGIADERVIFPDDSKYYVAIGAALVADKQTEIAISELIDRLNSANLCYKNETKYLEPLFMD